MQNRSIFWIIFPPFSLLFILFLLSFTFYSIKVSRAFFLEGEAASLQNHLKLIADAGKRGINDWNEFAKHHADITGLRVTLVAENGDVLGDSHEEFSRMDNHAERQEIKDAQKKC